jgi:phospholipid/cholesterol/gamma-HCH transport system substrate-binding protein
MEIKPKAYGKGKQFAIEFFTGLFFLIAISMLIYYTALLKGKELFAPKPNVIKARFERVGTLGVNDKVCVIGMQMGKVKSLALADNYKEVVVVMNLSKDVPLYKDYSIAIRHSSIFGGSYINIIPGGKESMELVDKKQILNGEPPVDILNEASDLMASLKEDEQKLREVLIDGKLLENIGDAANGFKDGAKEFSEIMKGLKKGDGTLAKLINDPSMYNDAKKMFESVNNASEKINKALDDINNSKGTLGKLISDKTAYEDMLKTLKDLREITSSISSGNGTLGKFVNDKGKLYDAMYESLEATKQLANQLKNGKGTLGHLMHDDKLYVDLVETVRQIRAAVEDYREQAPIATFGSMALGAL